MPVHWKRRRFVVSIVLGPFLLSLGLRLGLQSNLHAGERQSHLCGAGGRRQASTQWRRYLKMTCVVSTRSNAPFKRYVRANRRKIGLVTDVREATRFNHSQLVVVLGRVRSILPSCYFEYEELVPLETMSSANPLLSQATTPPRYRSGRSRAKAGLKTMCVAAVTISRRSEVEA
jgi:hypothetical protein